MSNSPAFKTNRNVDREKKKTIGKRNKIVICSVGLFFFVFFFCYLPLCYVCAAFYFCCCWFVFVVQALDQKGNFTIHEYQPNNWWQRIIWYMAGYIQILNSIMYINSYNVRLLRIIESEKEEKILWILEIIVRKKEPNQSASLYENRENERREPRENEFSVIVLAFLLYT